MRGYHGNHLSLGLKKDKSSVVITLLRKIFNFIEKIF